MRDKKWDARGDGYKSELFPSCRIGGGFQEFTFENMVPRFQAFPDRFCPR